MSELDQAHQLPKIVDDLLEVATKKGLRLWVVGGAVRELLRGQAESIHDLDISTSAEAIAVLTPWCEKRWGVVVELFPKVNTSRFSIHGSAELIVDLAMTRKETYPRPGKLPRVEAATIEEDVGRRDFSVNAMVLPLAVFRRALDGQPFTKEIIDRFGGQEDLQTGVLRILHRQSFLEDPIRILRGVRYAARFGWKFDPETFRVLQEDLSGGVFSSVPGNRLRTEFERVLLEDNVSGCLELLADWNIFEQGFSFSPGFSQRLRQAGEFLLSFPASERLQIFLALVLSLHPENEILLHELGRKKRKQLLELSATSTLRDVMKDKKTP